MAVYTEVSPAALDALLADYDLGTAKRLTPIAAGVENTNYFLSTTGGEHVLTVFERRTPEADLPYFLRLTEHLRDRGAPCPRPRRRIDGGLVSRVAGKAAAIVERLPGATLDAPGLEECREGGAALGRLHRASAGFPLARPNPLGAEGVAALLAELEAPFEALAPDLASDLSTERRALETWRRAGLPSGAVHTDLFPDNALFEGDLLIGVIDFYFAADEAFAYDLAVVLISWCGSDEGLDAAKTAALLSAYRRERALSVDEEAALLPLCRAACLRFLLTRLYDVENPREDALVTPKDPLEYADKLRFFRRLDGLPGEAQ